MEIIQLLKKDLLIEMRSKYAIYGILLYLISIVFICYYAFSNGLKAETWNALFWIVAVFISISAMTKSFVQEDPRSLYYYFLVEPEKIIASKILYNASFLILLLICTHLVFEIFLGSYGVKGTLYIFNLFLGTLGLSSAFTMVSAISSKAKNYSVLMPVLGLPVILPVVILSSQSSKILMLGGEFSDISTNLTALMSVVVIIIALSFILFPYTWKN